MKWNEKGGKLKDEKSEGKKKRQARGWINWRMDKNWTILKLWHQKLKRRNNHRNWKVWNFDDYIGNNTVKYLYLVVYFCYWKDL